MIKTIFIKINLLLILIFFTNIHAKSISFLAIGDTPYNSNEELELNNIVIPKIQKSNYPFTVVYGDILSGSESCTNELLTKRLNTFYNIKPNKVFYTPGDNEWTDCDRAYKHTNYSELQRLEYIRKYISSHKPNPPKKWNYKIQKKQKENARWLYKGIQFATIHMVGTNNGRKQILKDDKKIALDEVDTRDNNNLKWLDKAFKNAINNNAKAVVIISQADVTKSKEKKRCTNTKREKCNPFKYFIKRLKINSKEFKKPVLFLHGDTNPYCFDKKFGKKKAPNLWRLNAWGDGRSHADATVVKFNPNNKKSPFESHTLISNDLPKSSCKKN
jgi:hypothetical protein